MATGVSHDQSLLHREQAGSVREAPLATYLHDHLAGSEVAVSLLGSLINDHPGEELARFAAELEGELESERKELEQLVSQLHGSPGRFRRLVARVGAKASRVKLGRKLGGELGTFEALEMLKVGILGKLGLWEALASLSSSDDRLQRLDYDRLIAQAKAQHFQVEQRRLAAAQRAFRLS